MTGETANPKTLAYSQANDVIDAHLAELGRIDARVDALEALLGDARSKNDALSKKLLEASLEQLKSLRTGSASSARYERLSQRLLADNPTHLPLLLELLAYARSVPPPKPKASGAADKEREELEASRFRAAAVSEAAERVLAVVDQPALALYYGKAQPEAADAPNRKAAKKEAKVRATL